MELSKEEIAILDHTATRASAGAYCGDSPAMHRLVDLGLMRFRCKVDWVPEPYFVLTDAGRDELRRIKEAVA